MPSIFRLQLQPSLPRNVHHPRTGKVEREHQDQIVIKAKKKTGLPKKREQERNDRHDHVEPVPASKLSRNLENDRDMI